MRLRAVSVSSRSAGSSTASTPDAPSRPTSGTSATWLAPGAVVRRERSSGSAAPGRGRRAGRRRAPRRRPRTRSAAAPTPAGCAGRWARRGRSTRRARGRGGPASVGGPSASHTVDPRAASAGPAADATTSTTSADDVAAASRSMTSWSARIRASDASAARRASTSSRSYRRRWVASKTVTRTRSGPPSDARSPHRADQGRQRRAVRPDDVERDLAHLPLHLQQRRVVRLVVDPAAAGEQLGEPAPTQQVLAAQPGPVEERLVDPHDRRRRRWW